MNSRRAYTPWSVLDVQNVTFTLGADRSGKPQINMFMAGLCTDVAVVTPACVTNWPRVTGDGNFGTMWGPADISKAKYSLDLTDGAINNKPNPNFDAFAAMLTDIDDRLLDFVLANQLKILGRKNLSREEIKMLQIRTVRPKYDKTSGALIGHSIQMTAPKFAWDGMGGKYDRKINVCDQNGKVVPDGDVAPGDVVASTVYANQVYTGVGGDKFGIHWSFEAVSVVCQRAKLETCSDVPAFAAHQYDFAQPYTSSAMAVSQFSD